ncbi:U3 small nucleolar RNA-associated protein 20 [Rosa rugosa]|uniref:U3 small nucleolar RNA-associated protein 20 n=1 Tax=Rosa rugosa TaxID=74645 RepID=UPI002B40F7CF|nr:U3 small nucleolar RNA-associated protein 20 [Rosa rugosa]
MATSSQAQAVKSLNKSAGRRRFVFKSVSERLEEVEIDVFRSLDKLKDEPSPGSTFFRDCLVEWRELNTAEDFISFHEQMTPLVQTLPLILLHKETIFEALVSRLQISARLSLEPILRLIAALSRDLLEDFIPFLPRIVDSLVSLLDSGADREPEIVEQIFTSWSCIMRDLQKYLVHKLVDMLEVTAKLRYYPKNYVQELMAQAMGFLLRTRTAPFVQLDKGVRKIMLDVVEESTPFRKYGVSALLYYAMTGTSTRFHSRAKQVLLLLMDNSILGSATVIEVLISALQRLCEDLDSKELNLMFECLYQEIKGCVTNGGVLRLSRLLSLLVSTVQVKNGKAVSDYKQMLEIVGVLVRTYIIPSGIQMGEEHLSEVVDKIFQLMLSILSGLHTYNDLSTIFGCSLQWAPVFDLQKSSLLGFIQQLLQKDICIVDTFRVNILRVMNVLIETSEEDVIYLLVFFCERLQRGAQSFKLLDGSPELSRIQCFLSGTVSKWVGVLKGVQNGDLASTSIHEADLALLWGIINCFPQIVDSQEGPSLLLDLTDAIDQLLMIEDGNIAGFPKRTWQSLIGTSLNSYYKLTCGKNLEPETSRFLVLGKRHKSCSHVLVAVADFLDSLYGSAMDGDTQFTIYHPELSAYMAMDALKMFADNLCHPDRGIRASTLRILCHFETLSCDEPVLKKMKTELSPTSHVDNKDFNVLQLLLSIESTPLSISTSRKVTLLISRIQMGLSAGKISEAYLPLVVNGMIGIFHNRFSHLWNPVSECLAVLISRSNGLVWENFLNYFEQCQSLFQASIDQVGQGDTVLSNKSSDLVERFNLFVTPTSDSTPTATVLSSLLQSLQKLPIIESKSHQILPLFLKFLGYNCENFVSVGSFNSNVCKGKEWKRVLKEWLNLLKLMYNLKHSYQNQFLKEVLQNRLLDENDAEVQMKVLDCLLIWKDDFLLPYSQQLKNLVSVQNLREELTRWSLSRESNLIEEQHRAYLVPIVIRLLIPNVRKLKKHASQKHSRVNHRKAVLGFIAQLDVEEIPLFFALLIKPLQIISIGSEGAANWFWSSSNGSVEEFRTLNFLKYFTFSNITALSSKKRSAFLHVIEDVLGVFDASRVGPFLDFIMGCVVRILGSSTLGLDVAKGKGSSSLTNYSDANLASLGYDGAVDNNVLISTAVGQLKDLRSLSLKIVSFVLNKYEDHDFSCEFWDLFFGSVKPLIDGFKQEGFSGQKPSSLFSCFLAMSRSEKLVSLLCREQNLVPDILSILTVTSASEAIVACVLNFVENLLILDDELGVEDNAGKRVILLYLEALVDNLHCLFENNVAAKRKLLKHPGETEVWIFKILPKYISDALSARKFVDILLPVLANGAQDSEFRFEAVQVICDIIPVLGSDVTNNILNAVSPLLISTDLDKRLVICNLLDTLARADPSVQFVAKLVQDLNATSITEIDSLDYDRVLNAYGKITVDMFNTIQEDHALVILSHCVYDMSSDESTLRHRAYDSLLSFVEFSALILGKVLNNDSEMPDKMLASEDHCWTKVCIQRIISKFLLKHMANAMKSGTAVREEWVELLREMVLKLPEVANLGSLKPLQDENLEIDFFKNILHIQKHRRARAMKRFKNFVTNSYMPEGITKKLFVPFFFTILMEEEKGEHIKNMCIEVIASISSREWSSSYLLLMRCFNEISKNPLKQKLLLRLICSILHQFHFSETIDTASVNETQTCLHKTVLPKIQKLLSDSEKVSVNISLAALRVLKLLPGDVMDSQLPSIIHRISNFLKNRLESIRDEARSALADCLKELGLEYLHFIVKVLRSTLKRGFELHVLGYTLNFILSKFLVTPISGKLDYCLEDLLSIAQNDILGDVAEEKEVEKIASKMKETKKQKSFETLKLIAQSITFKSHALKLLSPVITQFEKHLTPKTKSKLESMLNHIAAGIECNPTVDQTDLFIFVHGLIEDGIKEENGKGETSFITGGNGHRRRDLVGKVDSSGRIAGAKSVCSHLISVFALGMLQKRIKNLKVRKNDVQILSMLDPFVILLGKGLNSKYEDVLSATLRCLTSLVRLHLPAIEDQADSIKAVLFDIAHSWLNTGSSLMESCLRLLTVLLRGNKITLSSDHLHLLIQLPVFVDIERDPSFVALSLLKAIVKRKLVVPEIYDLVTRVSELMVTSQVEPIRHKCSQILSHFLNDYPLSEKRLQQHLDFLLSNLRYEHSSGRKTVLEMLHAVIVKNPRNVVDEQSQTFFVHLVVCLANDRDNEVRLMAGAAIKRLTGCVSPRSLLSILEYSLSWYLGEKQQLWGAAAQVLGLLVEVEVMKKRFHKHINSVLKVTKSILQSAIDAVTHDSPHETAIPFWKEAFYSLVMLEKILNQFHDLCFDRDLEDIWEAICELLLHPHMWLRCISSRLIAFYFASVKESCSGDHENPFGTYYLIKPNKLFMIAAYICCQLKTQLIDDAANKLITQNLAFTVCGVHSLMGQTECADSHQFWFNLEQHEQDRFLKAFELLEARKGKTTFLSLTSGMCDANDENPSKNIRCLLVSNLLKKMGKIALQMEAVQMKIVFDCFEKILSEMSREDCLLYAYEMLQPLYKVCEGFSGTVIPENMKQLAEEVSGRLRSKLGSQNYVQVYNDIRKQLKAKRDKRKQDEKRLAVVNPMQNAKRKLRIAEKHRANKKRKMMTMKMGRWAHHSKSK